MSTHNVIVIAPLEWAGRSLTASEPEGGPFVASFDASAHARVTSAQAQYLLQHSGLRLRVEEVPQDPQPPETVSAHPPSRPKTAARKKG